MGCIGDDGRDIIVYLLMLIPLEIIMTSTRVVKDGNRRKAVAITGTLLALMSAVKVGWEVTNKAPSYFDMMEVIDHMFGAQMPSAFAATASATDYFDMKGVWTFVEVFVMRVKLAMALTSEARPQCHMLEGRGRWK